MYKCSFLVLDQATCAAPHVPNARPADALGKTYSTGDHISYVCESGYEFEGTDGAQCEDGVWRLPVCKGTVRCAAVQFS